MLPLTDPSDIKKLNLVLSYLQANGNPGIRFVKDFFRKYEIKETEFIDYLKQWGPDILKLKVLTASKSETPPAPVHSPYQGSIVERPSQETLPDRDQGV